MCIGAVLWFYAFGDEIVLFVYRSVHKILYAGFVNPGKNPIILEKRNDYVYRKIRPVWSRRRYIEPGFHFLIGYINRHEGILAGIMRKWRDAYMFSGSVLDYGSNFFL